MKKIRWAAILGIFVVVVAILGMFISFKSTKQNSNAKEENNIFPALQVDLKNEIKDYMYWYEAFPELKRISEAIKGIDTAPFEEMLERYEKKGLYSEDFQVEYEGLTISKETTEKEIIDYLGFPETFENYNGGLVNSSNGYRRWSLCYPNQYGWREGDEDERKYLRIVVMSERGAYYSNGTWGTWVEPENSYLVFINLEHNVETSRGIKVGDTVENVLEAYGSPDIVRYSESDNEFVEHRIELMYMGDGVSLRFRIGEREKKVEVILIDINMKKADIDQGLCSDCVNGDN